MICKHLNYKPLSFKNFSKPNTFLTPQTSLKLFQTLPLNSTHNPLNQPQTYLSVQKSQRPWSEVISSPHTKRWTQSKKTPKDSKRKELVVIPLQSLLQVEETRRESITGPSGIDKGWVGVEEKPSKNCLEGLELLNWNSGLICSGQVLWVSWLGFTFAVGDMMGRKSSF